MPSVAIPSARLTLYPVLCPAYSSVLAASSGATTKTTALYSLVKITKNPRFACALSQIHLQQNGETRDKKHGNTNSLYTIKNNSE